VTKGATGLAVVLTVLLIGLLALDGHAASSNGGAAAAERSRQAIASDARVQAALAQIKKDDATTLREQMRLRRFPRRRSRRRCVPGII